MSYSAVTDQLTRNTHTTSEPCPTAGSIRKAVIRLEALPTMGTGPELILDIEPPATNTTSFK